MRIGFVIGLSSCGRERGDANDTSFATGTGTTDAGTTETGATDAGTTETGTTETGTTEAGTTEAGTTEAGTTEAGTTETGEVYFGLAYNAAHEGWLVRFDQLPGSTRYERVGVALPGAIADLAVASYDDALLGADNEAGQLVWIDPGTAEVETVAAYSIPGLRVESLTYAPDGKLYATGTLPPFVQFHLYRVDEETAVFTEIGIALGDAVSSGFQSITSMDFASDGTLYGSNGEHLYVVDLDTLAATRLGDWSWSPSPEGVDFDVMTSLEEGSDGLLRGFAGNRLYSFNPNTPNTPPALIGTVGEADDYFVDLVRTP